MLAHFEPVEHPADTHANHILPAQRPAFPFDGRDHRFELPLCGLHKLFTLTTALLGQKRIPTNNQPLAGIIRRGDLG